MSSGKKRQSKTLAQLSNPKPPEPTTPEPKKTFTTAPQRQEIVLTATYTDSVYGPHGDINEPPILKCYRDISDKISMCVYGMLFKDILGHHATPKLTNTNVTVRVPDSSQYSKDIDPTSRFNLSQLLYGRLRDIEGKIQNIINHIQRNRSWGVSVRIEYIPITEEYPISNFKKT
jgi:hypothetical protein